MRETKTSRFEAIDSKGNPALFSISTDIMDYIEPARTFGPADLADPNETGRYQPRVLAIPDRRLAHVSPMVLTLGNQGRLVLVRRSEKDSAGWERIDLSAQIDPIAKGRVTAFGTAWVKHGDDNKVVVAMAVEDAENPKRSRIFIAYDLNTRQTDWYNLRWADYGCRDNLRIDAIRILRDADGIWSVLLSAGDGTQHNAYLIRSDRDQSFQSGALVFSTATDVKAIQDFQIGPFGKGGALHLLGLGHGDNLSLTSRPIPEFDSEGKPEPTSVWTFKCPESAHVLAMGFPYVKNNGSLYADLFIGGKGVHRIEGSRLDEQEDVDQETVIDSNLIGDVKRLVTGEDQTGAATVWALSATGQLVVTHRAGRGSKWESALSIREDVVEVAPVEGDDSLTTSVLLVYTQGRATHLWRDAAGTWQEEQISIADPSDATATTCFCTNLGVMDEFGCSRIGIDVTVRSSVPATLVINGRSYAVGPHSPAKVQTNFTGNIAIFNRAMSFSPATYRLAIDGMNHNLDINPASSLYTRFGTMTADELCNAKTPDGEYLLPNEYREQTGRSSVDTLLQAMKKAGELVKPNANDIPGVWLVLQDAPFSSAVSSASLPDGYCWGVSTNGQGQMRTLDDDQTRELVDTNVPASDSKGLGDSISDFFEGIVDGAKTAVSWVIRKVDDAVEFVCSIGGKIKRFVLDVVEKIGSFFEWAWDCLKTGVQKAWNFLKYLFNWGDIIAVRNKLSEFVEQDLQDLKKWVSGLKDTVGPHFDNMLQAIREKGEELGVKTADRSTLTKGSGAIAKETKGHGQVKDAVLGGGPVAWVLEQVGKLGSQIVEFEVPESDAPENVLANAIEAQLQILREKSDELGEDFKEIFDGKDFSIKDLDIEKIKKIILVLTVRIADAAVRSLKDLTLALIDGLVVIIDYLRQILFTRIRLPFVEKLLKLVTGKTHDVSTTLIEVLLFVPAVLTTITYKLVIQDVPLADALALKLPPANTAMAQASRNTNALLFIKGVSGTFIGFVVILIDAVPASLPAVATETTKASWFFCVAGALAHVAANCPWLPGRARPLTTEIADLLICTVGIVQFWLDCLMLKESLLATVEAVTHRAALDVVGFSIQLVLKIIGFAADDDGRDPWEFVQFCGRTAAQGVLQACRLVNEPQTKWYMVVGAELGNLGLNFVPGLFRATNGFNSSNAALQASSLPLLPAPQTAAA